MATMGVIEACRILSGWKGNLTESKGSIGVSLVLIVPAVLSCVYLLVFQSYVLRWVLHYCRRTTEAFNGPSQSFTAYKRFHNLESFLYNNKQVSKQSIDV